MKDNKEFINGIYKKYDEYLKERNVKNMEEENKEKFIPVKNTKAKDFEKHVFMKRNFVKILSAAAVFTVVLSGVLVSKNLLNKDENIIVGKTETSKNLTLNKVNDFETFYKIVKDNYKEDNTRNYIYDMEDSVKSTAEDMSVNSKTTSVSGTTENNDYSKTNIQVENVDEADIVKTNGKYIFYVVNSKVLIFDIQDKSKINKLAEISYEDEKFKPTEIYINDNKLIVMGNQSTYSYPTSGKVRETSTAIYKKGIYKERAVAIVYDVTNISKPNEIRRVELEGKCVSSRMIDNNIYFVANKSIYAREIANYSITDLDEDLVKPMYRDTVNGSSEKMIDFDRIYYFNNINTINYLTLGGFSLDSKDEVDIQTFLGAGENIYCSTKNMYVIKSKNVYDADTYMSYGKDTKILKFNLNNGKINFKAEANIEGAINNQFSMDEKDDYFRIATTIGKTYNMDESTSNSLYVLDDKLQEVGRLDGIAKGEKIYSVRYSGNRAYVVTFKEIDPLFVIDLSDVKNPKILGELKIPGYSTYLHPYDETHLIGFGYDTKSNYNNTGVVKDGLKMSMFDISDFNNPKEMFTVKIGKQGTNSPLANNHKALLFSKEKNLIAFPISTYESGKTKYRAQVYDIDLNKGFTLKGEIEHNVSDINNTDKYYSSYKLNIERIIYSNNVFYTLSNALIKASDMDSIKEITKINIDTKSNNTPVLYNTVDLVE